MTVTCPHCKEPAERVTGNLIYMRRKDLAEKYFWRCEPCRAYVGCHPGTDTPLGPLAKASTRSARAAAHDAFDPIWQELMAQGLSKRKARSKAYAWLSRELGGLQSNIGQMEEAKCRRVIAICKAQRGKPLIDPLPGEPCP
jgi:hypothetical protein